MCAQFINDWLDAQHQELIAQVNPELQTCLRSETDRERDRNKTDRKERGEKNAPVSTGKGSNPTTQ